MGRILSIFRNKFQPAWQLDFTRLFLVRMNDQAALASLWQKLARRSARKVNLGWWLQSIAPWLIGASVLIFISLLWLRNQPGATSLATSVPWPWLLLCLPLLAIVAFFISRNRFITPTQALVRLESELRLHNALSVAQAGHGPWPALSALVQDGWQWRWGYLSLPWVISIALVTLGYVLPVSTTAIAPPPNAEPQAWQQMEEWLSKLEEEKLITPEEKEEQAAKIADLRDQPPEKWFSHDSLHASDTLKDQLQRDMARLSQNLSRLERSLNALQNHAEQLSQTSKDQLLSDIGETLRDLQKSGLELHPDLLKELKNAAPENLSSLSPEQLNELKDTLKKGAEGMSGLGSNPGFLGDGTGADDELAEMLRQMGEGNMPNAFQDGKDSQPGEGGISRGPGTAPLTLADEENNFGTNKSEAVSNPDLRHAQLSTQLGVQDGQHKVDKTYQGPTAAGQTTHTGQGGEQVWRDTLTPEEQAVLKRVFK